MSCIGIIVAAGSARRMGGIDKIMAPLLGVPLLLRTVRALAASEKIEKICIVTRPDLLEPVRALCAGEEKVSSVIPGGQTRTESVLAGLSEVGDTALVAVHDGARPLVTVPVIDAAIEAAERYGAAAPAVAVHDTIKVAKNGLVTQTPARDTLFAVQTPQVFSAALLRRALEQTLARGIAPTDDCAAVEALGLPVFLTEGSEENQKITVPLDLTIAEAVLLRREV